MLMWNEKSDPRNRKDGMNLSEVKAKVTAFLLPSLTIFVLTIMDLLYRSGSITRRMATASSDDNPIVFSLIRADPNSFKTDFYARVIADTQQNSIISKLSYWILQNDILSSKQVWIIILATQRVLLYVAVYLFLRKLTNTYWQALLALAIFSSSTVYYWNLGWFGALDDQPYPMWMAMPFIIFGLLYSRDQSQNKILFSLIATVLIHPSIGLVFAGWIIFDNISNREFRNLKKLAVIFSIIFTYILFSKLQMPKQARMPDSIKDIGLTNPHLNFFNVFETDYKASSIRIWILLIVFSLLAVKYEIELSQYRNKHLVQSLAVYSGLLLIVQVLSLQSKEIMFISLVPLRFTSVLITIGYLIVLSHVIVNLFNWPFLARVSGLIFLLVPSPFIVSLFGIKAMLNRSKFSRVAHLPDILIIMNIIVLVMPTILSYFDLRAAEALYETSFFSSYFNPLNTGFMNFMVPSLFSNQPIQFLMTICFGLVIIFPAIINRKTQLFFRNLTILSDDRKTKLVYIFITVVFVTASRDGMQHQIQWSFNGVDISTVDSYADAQIWARDHTAPDSVFFIDGSMPPYYTWRTLSERPVSNPNPIWSFYNYPQYADEHNQERELFWEAQLENKSLDYPGQWNENYFCLSQELSNISFVVQNHEQKELLFPKAYSNEKFVIYRVECK
jgi:hypothetical protein